MPIAGGHIKQWRPKPRTSLGFLLRLRGTGLNGFPERGEHARRKCFRAERFLRFKPRVGLHGALRDVGVGIRSRVYGRGCRRVFRPAAYHIIGRECSHEYERCDNKERGNFRARLTPSHLFIVTRTLKNEVRATCIGGGFEPGSL